MHFSAPITVLFAAFAAASPALVPRDAESTVFVSVPVEAAPVEGLASRDQPPWAMGSWSGNGCDAPRSGVQGDYIGDVVNWSKPAGYKGCTNMANVRSIVLHSWGTCNTYLYSQPDCPGQADSIHNLNACYFANDGSQIKSFYVWCN